MHNIKLISLCFSVTTTLLIFGCSTPSSPPTELMHYPVDNLEALITTADVRLDQEISSDGKGSLRISVTQPTTIELYQTGNLDIENARLIYQAKLRTEDVAGKVYLEMWCEFAGKGAFFSRGLDSPATGNTDWSTKKTSFFLKKGENPDNIKLNLVIAEKGTVWIDDIYLLQGPLQ